MKVIEISDEYLKALSKDQYSHFVVSTWVGDNDILTVNGEEIEEMYYEQNKLSDNFTFLDLLNWYLSEKSVNSYDVLTTDANGIICEVRFVF